MRESPSAWAESRESRSDHRYYSPVREFQSGVKFIRERLSIDGLAAHARFGGVSALNHELGNHSVENGIVVISLQAKLDEILAGLGCLVGPELNLQLSLRRVKNDLAGRGRFLSVCLCHAAKVSDARVRKSKCPQKKRRE